MRTRDLLWTARTAMKNMRVSKLSTLVAFRGRRSYVIIEMQAMEQRDSRRFLALLLVCRKYNVCDVGVVLLIFSKVGPWRGGGGRSSYARKRRARSIGRCERCYRVYPPIVPSKCDNKTCVPGISFNLKVADFIRCGVTEVIPHPGYHF
uniref:RNA silencing suppressor n=1 Tax=Magnolia carlavirus TaxID=1346080 RepID=T1RSB6_9VIRU|nr:16 kDa protein [Magnolia carlavirus]